MSPQIKLTQEKTNKTLNEIFSTYLITFHDQQVFLFHCSNKKGRTNISYNISQQHCDEKIINMGSGWMCFILEHLKYQFEYLHF